MPLSVFAALVGAPSKWCQNALAVLGLPLRYTPTMARTLGLARLLNERHGIPSKDAFRIAGEVLPHHPARQVSRTDDEGISTLTVDVPRYLSDFTVRLSAARRDPPRGRGRPPASRRSTGARAAAAHGIDLGALRAGLRLSPAERLGALDTSQRLVERLRKGKRGA